MQNYLIFFLVSLLLSSCQSLPDRSPVPNELVKSVGIPGIPGARFWGDEWSAFSFTRFNSLNDEILEKDFSATYEKEHHYLTISGGGPNGAYGAGLLTGWSELGTRPEFTMVTGVSTGALSAPYAFLGSDYDFELKKLYTTHGTKDIVNERNIISAAFGDALSGTEPLLKIIQDGVTKEVVAKIAAEHKKGRRLFIGTVNLDAGRSVIWNIGAIAISNHAKKDELIHQVILASASIPVAFPPVQIDVDAGGKTYHELHVDGGTASQVFVYPAAVDWKAITKKLKVKGTPKVYVIRNAFLKADYQGINRSVLPIAARSIDTLIRTQGIGDIYQIFALCKRDGNDFKLTYIPESFTEKAEEIFDVKYMRKLYQFGIDKAKAGDVWTSAPPNFIK